MHTNVKKAVALLLGLIMLFTMLPLNVFAAGTFTVSVDASAYANGVEPGTTVELPVVVSENDGIAVFNLSVDFDPNVFSFVSITKGADFSGEYTLGDANSPNCVWVSSDGSDVTGTGTLFTVSLKVLEGASGSSTVTLRDDGTYNTAGEVITPNITGAYITVGTVSTADYTAALSSTAPEVTKGEDVSVTVTVDGTVGTYNAAEITLSYPSILTYKGIAASGTGDEITVDNNTTGKLYIVDKGSENSKNTTYTVTFTSVETGTDEITLDAAYFGTREESQTKNLNEAEITASSVEVTVDAKTFDVTFPDDEISTGNKLFTSTQTPTEGENFIFTATNSNYTYSNVVVKVGETEATATEIEGVTGNQANGWTVPGTSITGNLYVTATATPKQYAVKYSYVDKDGNTQTGTDGNATYGTPYVYNMPDGVAASGTVDGFHYEVGSLTIGGVSSDQYNPNLTDNNVTVFGAAIIGTVEITLVQVTDPADSWSVAVSADEGVTTSEYSVASSVKKGETIALTVIPQTGYTYTVTAKTTDDDTNVPLTQNGNVYTTTAGVTENITFVVTRAVDTGSFEYELYLEGGMGEGADPNKNMYLVKIGTKIADKHYTINGQNMYWSEKYGAYAYVVIADAAPTADAFTFTIENNAEDVVYEVSYDKNVNKSADGTVDANDAQLVYDMYNKEYKLVTDNVSVLKFLEADVATTEDKGNLLDVNDAAAIVTAVLERMNGSTN